MYRGTTRFKCTECGEVFKAPDIEYKATVYSVPQPCPHCESIRTMPHSILPFSNMFNNSIYESIWKSMEERR